MEMHDRLKKAREAIYKTASDAARSLGVVRHTYIQHENGIRGFRKDAAVFYARKFRVNLDWLLTGRGPMESSADPAGAISVPILSWVSAGKMALDDAPDVNIGSIDQTGLDSEGDWIALRVDGTSMDRISPPQSIIIVNRKDRRLVNNACYVIADSSNGASSYKRFRANPSRFEPVSTEGGHETLFPDNEPIIVGRVRRSILDL